MRLTMEELERRLEEFVDRARRGETFEVERDGRVVAKLEPPLGRPRNRAATTA